MFVISHSISAAELFSLVQCLWARPSGADPIVEHLKCASLGFSLTGKYLTRLENPAGNKHSSLLRTFVASKRRTT